MQGLAEMLCKDAGKPFQHQLTIPSLTYENMDMFLQNIH